MKVIIAGGRNLKNPSFITQAITKAKFDITEVVSGGAKGIDRLGEEWAKDNNIKLSFFTPDWLTNGKIAGFVRNEQMAEYADALIAIWDGYSRGTANMIANAVKHELKISIFSISKR